VKIYLDASALNRPFDDHSVDRNRLESEAVLVILQNVERGQLELMNSSALLYETVMSPLVERREYVTSYLDLATVFVTIDEDVRVRARQLTRQGIAPVDALHLACAARGGADWFITCDDHILRLSRRGKLKIGMRVSSPIEFVLERRLLNG
jgi:predicted nucleic acid-binding protein